jgi:phage terminase small subunit
MPILRNLKHEQFAQFVANGINPTEAYVSAGYSDKGAHASASRLLGVATVRARVEQLRSAINNASLEKAILDRAWVIEGLKRIAEKAESENDFSPAIKAHELLGKELGMFVNRIEAEHSGEMTVHDGSKERLLSKLTGLITSGASQGSDQRIN